MTTTFTLHGIDAVLLPVSVAVERRLPALVFTGVSGVAAREIGERVRASILSAGFEFPRARIVVTVGDPVQPATGWSANAKPPAAHSPGTGIDIAVAAEILGVSLPSNAVVAGELTLRGELRSTRGAACLARSHPDRLFIGPVDMARRVVACGGTAVGIRTLGELVELSSTRPVYTDAPPLAIRPPHLRFEDVHGLATGTLDTLRACAQTLRPVLFVGPPGCGKTMLVARLPALLPALSEDERRLVAATQDAAGLARYDDYDGHADAAIFVDRPFRAPHHTISAAGPVGRDRPGEAQLASGGVLFLDDVTEFPRTTLEALRGALGSGTAPWLVLAATPPREGEDERFTKRLQGVLDALGLRDVARFDLARPGRAL